MSVKDLLIRITTKYSGQGTKDAEKDLKSLADEIKGLAPAFGLGVVLKEIGDFVIGSEMAAEITAGLQRSFVGLSGGADQAADNMAAMDEATRGLLSDAEQMAIANQLLGMRIANTSGELEKTVEVSRRLGKEFRGLGAKEAAEEFALMISNMSIARLDSFGISSGAVRARIEELMASTKAMTREQAFFQATMEEADNVLNRLGPEITTTSDRVERLKAEWADFSAAFGSIGPDDVGWIDIAAETATVFVEHLTEGAHVWDGWITNLTTIGGLLEHDKEATAEWIGMLVNGVDTLKRINPLLGLIAEIGMEAGVRLAAEQKENNEALLTGQAAAAETSVDIAEETDDKLIDLQRKTARDLLDIQQDAAADRRRAAEELADDLADAEEDHGKRLVKIEADAAKERVKIAKDLAKEKAREEQDLKKDLEKLTTDQAKRIADVETRSAKDDERQRKLDAVDALADERLFQFQLRQLQAEGEGLAIRDALERRAIEEEIAKEKAGVERQIEEEKRSDEIQAIRDEGEERRQQLELDSQERQRQIDERNTEEIEALNERIAEEQAAEAESYTQRQLELQDSFAERQQAIDEAEAEELASLGEKLTEMEGITSDGFVTIKHIADQMGPEIGKTLADGMVDGFKENQEINDLLKGLGGIGESGNTSDRQDMIDRARQLAGGNLGNFDQGGIVPGPIGKPQLAIVHGGEKITPPAPPGGVQLVVNINAPVYGVNDLQNELQKALDQLAARMTG